jgi:hypothetical protein
MFSMPTFAEVIELGLAFNEKHQGCRNHDKRRAGLMIETKDEATYRTLFGIEPVEEVLSLLEKYNVTTVNHAVKKL